LADGVLLCEPTASCSNERRTTVGPGTAGPLDSALISLEVDPTVLVGLGPQPVDRPANLDFQRPVPHDPKPPTLARPEHTTASGRSGRERAVREPDKDRRARPSHRQWLSRHNMIY